MLKFRWVLSLFLGVACVSSAQTTTDRLAGASASVAVKAPVKVVSTANLTLSGLQTVNGVALASGDRILVKDQSTASENGIYVASSSSWERSKDFDGARDVVDGTLVVSNNDTSIFYRVTTNDPITIDSSSIAFEVVSGAVTQSSIGAALFPRTATEISAGVTPTYYIFAPGDARRYGVLGDGSDDTTALRNWLLASAGAPYVAFLPKPTTKYVTSSLTIPSNIRVTCASGVIVEANSSFGVSDTLANFTGASNVVWDCAAEMRMVRADYASGEQRHIFNLVNCTDILLKNPVAKSSGGDGFYVNGATRVTIENPIADDNRRQGMSVIKATGLYVSGIARFTNTNGTAPQAGLDIEPNSDADDLINVVFDTVYTEGNDGDGVAIYLDDYKTGTPDDVSISFGKIISKSNGRNAFRVRNVFLNSGSYGGTISVGEVISTDDPAAAVYVEDKAVGAPLLRVGKVVAENPSTGSSSFADTTAVYVADTSAAASGGIHIDSVSAKATHTDMDYGVVTEMGGGYSDVRIGVADITGYQVAPVRLNNTSSAIADASTVLIDLSKLTDAVAITTGTNITASTHLGRVVTNAGAGAGLTAALQHYPPPGIPYRFRVETAQNLIIDPLDAADRIVGTTTAGASVQSNVVGASCDVYYLGTIGAVRYWRLQPLGNPASWTFN